jgi:hypothetical protein
MEELLTIADYDDYVRRLPSLDLYQNCSIHLPVRARHAILACHRCTDEPLL